MMFEKLITASMRDSQAETLEESQRERKIAGNKTIARDPHPPMRHIHPFLSKATPCFHNYRSVCNVFKATVLRSVNRLQHHVSVHRKLINICARFWCAVQFAIIRFMARFPASVLMDIEPSDNHTRETYISIYRWIVFLVVLKATSVPGILETQ